ncbi:MAG: Gfo/Idh/MocA family oxidoreductase [Candidatus Latescibacteria bacterium]|jgi:predicted dehydrogenase|nr:Gfo/Idh/MocA family oxidoreductase [Candidatus Latescibacterota bacterium]MBT5829251.1 Gfo/Idh/MocA family oxidoreductase [Candidatus Latescibacterota bacterium]
MVKMAQYGTKHGHGLGKLRAMIEHPDVDLVGVFEPDEAQRLRIEASQLGPDVHWFASAGEMLQDAAIKAVASEGQNIESLAQTEAIVEAGKHAWYDKPAGDDWAHWQSVVASAREQQLQIQMGYMFRYHEGYCKIAEWVKSGFLGEVFQVRAHMSTSLGIAQRERVAVHQGGIMYDLAAHQLDQIVWLLGRPNKVTSFLRNDSGDVPAFSDNTLGVFEYENAIVMLDISALETRPMARRFELYGTKGSAIMDPMEPADQIRLSLDEARGGFDAGLNVVPITPQSRHDLYMLELESFLSVIQGKTEPDRSYDHELLVQETLLRATGGIDL